MRHLSPQSQGLIAINIAAVIFGTAALYGKLALSPFWIASMRSAFAVTALLTVSIWNGGVAFPERSLWIGCIVSGVLLAMHWLTFFASVQLAGVAVATLTFATFPLFTVLITAWHQKRRPHLAEIAAAIGIIIAVALLVAPGNISGSVPGAAAGLASGLIYAWFWHASKPLSNATPGLRLSLSQNAVAALALTPFLAFATPMPVHLEDWIWLALLGTVNTAVMLQLYLYALQRISANTCSGFVALEPVYAILLAALFFREPITVWIVLSAALIVGASLTLLKVEGAP
jgi:drug/metabolite transporter (DMT)-like permease